MGTTRRVIIGLAFALVVTAGLNLPAGGVSMASRQGSASRLYLAYFDRKPEAAGLDYWTTKLTASSLVSVSEFFAKSPEFRTKYGSLDNGGFVDLIYRNVLGRTPDSGGRSYWKSQLDGGRKTRGVVMVGFSESAEFVKKTGTAPPETDPPTTARPVVTTTTRPSAVYWNNCTEAKNAGAAPIYRGQPGYRAGLDGDNDGIACET